MKSDVRIGLYKNWFPDAKMVFQRNPRKSDTAFGAEDVMFDRIALRAGATLKPENNFQKPTANPKPLKPKTYLNNLKARASANPKTSNDLQQPKTKPKP